MDTGTGLPHWSKASRSSLLVERTLQRVANEGGVNGEGARDRGDAGPAGAAGKAPQGGASERREEPVRERLSMDRKERKEIAQNPMNPMAGGRVRQTCRPQREQTVEAGKNGQGGASEEEVPLRRTRCASVGSAGRTRALRRVLAEGKRERTPGEENEEGIWTRKGVNRRIE